MNIGKTGPVLNTAGAGSFTIAANTNFDFRANVGTVSQILISVKTGTAPTAATSIVQWDGTTTFNLVSTAVATNALAFVEIPGNAGFGARIQNPDAAVAATAMYSGYTWKL